MEPKRKFQVIYAKTVDIAEIKQGMVFQIIPANDEDISCPKGLFQAQNNGAAGDDTIEGRRLHLQKDTPCGAKINVKDLVFPTSED